MDYPILNLNLTDLLILKNRKRLHSIDGIPFQAAYLRWTQFSSAPIESYMSQTTAGNRSDEESKAWSLASKRSRGICYLLTITHRQYIPGIYIPSRLISRNPKGQVGRNCNPADLF